MTELMRGGDKLVALLRDTARNLEKGKAVRVGYLEGARYPNGESVAEVAAINEFGKIVHTKDGDYFQLPRPSFRNMIAAKSPQWGNTFAQVLKANNYDARTSLDLMGFGIEGQLRQSIRDLTDPPLAPSTIARKGFDKPLIDTSHMINSVAHEVVE